jgi:hypothetical protein
MPVSIQMRRNQSFLADASFYNRAAKYRSPF